MANNEWYYNLKNLDFYVQKRLHEEGLEFDDFIYVKDIISMKVGMFRYKNIEKVNGLTSQVLEIALTLGANLCFANLPELGGVILCRYSNRGTLDLYGKPTKVSLISLSGITIKTDYPYEEIVPIRDNAMDIPAIIPLIAYIRKIKEIENTVFKLLEIGSLPLVMVGDKKQATALKETAKKLGLKNPFIVGDGTLTDSVKGFDIKLTLDPSDVYELKLKMKNECLISLGIYAVEEKRERLVSAEVSAKNDYADTIYQGYVDERKEALRKVKEKWGIELELIERYYTNLRDDIKIDAEKAGAIAKAESEGEKEDEPRREQ